ncbi:hypothetical protein NC652_005656 [Populus alba x Populus x berolinensis]|nr:hypothetical protein NC652_005656 [Populus alba x Populus x berolinensis]
MTSTASSGMVQLLLLCFRSGLPHKAKLKKRRRLLTKFSLAFQNAAVSRKKLNEAELCWANMGPQSADPLSVSPLQISVHSKSPNSPRSPNHVGSSKGDSSKGIPKKGSPLMHERHFFSMRLPRKRQWL